MKKLIPITLMLQIYGCANSLKPNSIPDSKMTAAKTFDSKPIVIDKDDGDIGGWGADFGLSIVSISENDSAATYIAESQWKDQKLGLMIIIPKGETKDGTGIVKIKTIGLESDQLLHFMAKLYKQKISASSHFVDSISVSFVDLNTFGKTIAAQYGAKGNSDSTIKEYKIFFEGPGKDDEAELYLNINNRENRIEIHEKDIDYRPDVIRYLSK